VTEPAQHADANAVAAAALEQEIDAAIALGDGDVRAALKVALIANSFLMAENEKLTRSASLGFRRGKMPSRRKASIRLDDWREISTGETDEESTA
jgi:hypothetical protein